MIIKIDNRNFSLNWHHDRTFVADPIPRIGQTTCVIRDLDSRATFWGVANCSTKDKYVKETGRLVSLQRAAMSLVNLFNDPAVKNEILQQYHNRRGG